MLDSAKDGNFAVNLGETRGVATHTVPLDELDSNLDATVLFPAQFHFAKFTLADGVTQNKVAELGIALVASAMIVSASLSSSFLMVITRRDNRRRRCGIFDVVVLSCSMIAIPVDGILSSCNCFRQAVSGIMDGFRGRAMCGSDWHGSGCGPAVSATGLGSSISLAASVTVLGSC